MAMRSRLTKPLLTVAAVLLVGWSIVSACKYPPAPTGPMAGCFAGADPVTCNLAELSVAAHAPYVLLVDGQQVLQGSESAVVFSSGLAIGSHDLSGTISRDTLSITLTSVASSTGGVVQSGSLSSASGPVGAVSACTITYVFPAGSPGPVPFDAHFVIASGSGATGCTAPR